jgi:transglutaminase-like putative cysteine protease
MTFERNFKISSYFMIGAGFTAAAATGMIYWLPVALFAAAFISGWFIDTARLRKQTPKWFLNCVSILCFLFFIADFMLLSRSFMVSVIHLILFTSIVKLLTLSKNRDYFFLYLTSFTLLLAASSMKVHLIFGICFLIFLFFGIHTFILFEMRLSHGAIQKRIRIHPFVAPKSRNESGPELFSPFPTRLLSIISFGVTLLILAVALPLFLLLPRSSSGYNRQPSGETQFVSGFSDSVELGRTGTVKQSDAVVMRVRVSKPPSLLPVDLKWRGLAFDYYNGRAWKRSDPVRRPVPVQGRYFKLEDSARGTDWLHQSFFIESLSTNVVFAARKALAVSRDAGSLTRDSAENLYVNSPEQTKRRYDVISDQSLPNPEFIYGTGSIPAGILKTCLQVPPLDGRIEELTKQVTAQAGNNYEKVKALEQYLHERYAYSLELKGTPGSKDPLSVFLFETRQGHCEYFASALAIMLRYAGIPSRLVNGFRIGEYNRIGDSWIVRQYHAHSWVEAYLPPYGWTEFDPTPVQRQYSRPEFAQFWIDMANTIDLWWWERVVNYDYSRQYNVIAFIYSTSAKIRDSIRDLAARAFEKSSQGFLWMFSTKETQGSAKVWVGAIILFIIMAFLIRPLRKQILKRMRPVLYRNRPRLYAETFYTEALEILSKYGIARDPDQTPMEFAKGLSNHPAGTSLFALTRLYNRVRFGPPDEAPGRTEADNLLRSLRRSLSG